MKKNKNKKLYSIIVILLMGVSLYFVVGKSFALFGNDDLSYISPNFVMGSGTSPGYNGLWITTTGLVQSPDRTGDFSDGTDSLLNINTLATYYANFTYEIGNVSNYYNVSYTLKGRSTGQSDDFCTIYCYNKASQLWSNIGKPDITPTRSIWNYDIPKSCVDNSTNYNVVTKMTCQTGDIEVFRLYVTDVYLTKVNIHQGCSYESPVCGDGYYCSNNQCLKKPFGVDNEQIMYSVGILLGGSVFLYFINKKR